MRSISRSQTLDGQQIDGSKDESKDGDRQREPSTEHVKTKGHRRRAMQNFASSIHSRMSDAQLLSMLPEEKRSWHEYLPFIGELLQPQKPQRTSEAIDKGFDSKLRTESRMLDHPQRLRWCAAAARLSCRLHRNANHLACRAAAFVRDALEYPPRLNHGASQAYSLSHWRQLAFRIYHDKYVEKVNNVLVRIYMLQIFLEEQQARRLNPNHLVCLKLSPHREYPSRLV